MRQPAVVRDRTASALARLHRAQRQTRTGSIGDGLVLRDVAPLMLGWSAVCAATLA